MYGNTVLIPLILLEQQRIILLTFFKFFRNPQKKKRESMHVYDKLHVYERAKFSFSFSLSSSFLWPGMKAAKV